MRIGSVGYATEQGLGYLMKDFYDNQVVTDVVIIRHGRRPTHEEWYPDGTLQISNLHSQVQIRALKEWCLGMDAVLFFETPFEWGLIPHCRVHGVKTVLMPMHECMPTRWPHQPDSIINPSPLEQKLYPNGTYIQVPVDIKKIPWHRRFNAEVFVHNAGHGGLMGRNGTAELITAMQYVKSPICLIIRTQDNDIGPIDHMDSRVEIRRGTFPRETLYREGDVFVFPEKFNGLSLPLQEGTAGGMAVMTTQRFPNTECLPKFIPIPVSSYRKARVSGRCLEFDEAIIDPRVIARVIDETYGTEISEYSMVGASWSQKNSWGVLQRRYLDFLGELTNA